MSCVYGTAIRRKRLLRLVTFIQLEEILGSATDVLVKLNRMAVYSPDAVCVKAELRAVIGGDKKKPRRRKGDV